MPRYKDEWVIDRVMFDFVSGGSCACCGFQHFLPNGTADLVDAISDLDTDQANQEKAALLYDVIDQHSGHSCGLGTM